MVTHFLGQYRCFLLLNAKIRIMSSLHTFLDTTINIYAKGMDGHIIMEVAIHEYAHHIHHTEQYTWDVRRKDRSHGEKFWRIYSAPMAKAICKDIFKDDLICDIITQ